MKIKSESLTKATAYKLLTGVVVPRPIAWVSTISSAGQSNVAPFSCFTFVSADPPMIGFNCGLRNGALKDTAANIQATGQFVVNIVDESLLNPMHQSAADFPVDIDEMNVLGIPSEASDIVAPRRIASSPISLECVLDQAVNFGRSGSQFIVGEIKLFHIRDNLFKNGKIDTESLRPLARLAGPVYSTLGDIIRVDKAEFSASA
ncbi:flavin reductase family protein [Tardiphaga sp. 866_E4_N2_1]|uniref:flavin reductase family protein n=1 Tax=unclassified Tardiphaga TaxID=2631404 RepID=UPI003F2929F8